MKFKYFCAASYYPNCRVHDSGYYSDLRFFPSLKEYLKVSQDQCHDYEFHDLHSIRGRMLGEIGYEYSSHGVKGLTAKIRWLEFRTVDDGHGNQKWVRKE